MNLEGRLNSLVKLGVIFKNIGSDKAWSGYQIGITDKEYSDFQNLINYLPNYNGWFTPAEVRKALLAWGNLLVLENLQKWINSYSPKDVNSEKVVAIIMAGNIPLVGFHDFLSVYLFGLKAKIKLSSDDNKLLPFILELLSNFDDSIKENFEFVNRKLEDFDAVIATGSNNTARYFHEYFGKYPNIIRKNRTSIAILSGDEKPEELSKLAEDVFTYYGLGCRNVTKLYLPQGYDLNKLFAAFYPFQDVSINNKYANNYDYHKALFLMEGFDLLENGFLLMKEDESLYSPIGTLYYEYYSDRLQLEEKIDAMEDKLQCVVSSIHIPFGKAQSPELWDYADNVDTVRFLLGL